MEEREEREKKKEKEKKIKNNNSGSSVARSRMNLGHLLIKSIWALFLENLGLIFWQKKKKIIWRRSQE